jgi:hypothetical protein
MRFGVRGFGRRAAARPGRGRCDVRRCGPAGPRHRGQQIAVGVCGDGVHGAGAVVVGQDHSEVVGGAVFGAAVHLVDACVGAVVMLVGFVGDGRINRQVVFVAAPSHADISHGTTRTIGQNRPADSSLIHPCFAPVRRHTRRRVGRTITAVSTSISWQDAFDVIKRGHERRDVLFKLASGHTSS